MDTGAADRRSLQLNRLKYCHRVNQPRSRRAPFNIEKLRLMNLIRPLECDRIAREFCRPPQRLAVGNIIIQKHQSIRRRIIFRNRLRIHFDRLRQRLFCHLMVLYDLKPLCFQPFKLLFPRIFEINAIRLYKAERIKMDLSLRCDFAV